MTLTLGGAGDEHYDNSGQVERREHVVQLRGLLHTHAQQHYREHTNVASELAFYHTSIIKMGKWKRKKFTSKQGYLFFYKCESL